MVDEDEEFIFIALNLYDFTLDDWIKKKGVTSEQACDLVEGLLKGLEYLHGMEMLHRDLKVSVIV